MYYVDLRPSQPAKPAMSYACKEILPHSTVVNTISKIIYKIDLVHRKPSHSDGSLHTQTQEPRRFAIFFSPVAPFTNMVYL